MIRNSPEIRPIAGALGAEIGGIDLTEDLDADTIAAIRHAWLDHLVIFFRGQRLTPVQLLSFARHFGEVVEYPFIKGLDGFPEITPVVKLEHERVNFGGLWHTDTAYLERPPKERQKPGPASLMASRFPEPTMIASVRCFSGICANIGCIGTPAMRRLALKSRRLIR